MVFRGAEQGFCVSVVVAHPRARVQRAQTDGTQGGLDGTGLEGLPLSPCRTTRVFIEASFSERAARRRRVSECSAFSSVQSP